MKSFRLVVINKTTIEYKEKSYNNCTSEKYNMGIFHNLQDVFGKNILVWLLPIKNEYSLEGYAYNINVEYISSTKEKREEDLIL